MADPSPPTALLATTSPPSGYEAGVGNARDTVGLISEVVTLASRPVSSYFRRRSTQQALRDKLGEWATEAVDAQGRWRQPVLSTRPFEEHLIAESAHFKPQGVCQSSLGWAHLLYALNIRPGGGVLRWKVPTNGVDAAETGTIVLEIDGQCLSHIINLYRTYSTPEPSDLSKLFETSGKNWIECRTPFGNLSLQAEDGKIRCWFEPGAPEDLSLERIPFSHDKWFLPPQALSFDAETVVARYLQTLEHGVSESKLILPSPKAPIRERISALLSAEIDHWRPWSNPFLSTASWMDSVIRIKKRLLMDGEEQNMTLADDILTNLEQIPEAKAILQQQCLMYHRTPDWKPVIQKALYGTLNHAVSPSQILWVGGPSRARSTPMTAYPLDEHLEQSITMLGSSPVGSWKHTVSEMTPQVLRVMRMRMDFVNEPVLVLELTSDHMLWNSSCVIVDSSAKK